jgi:hypothetical protein
MGYQCQPTRRLQYQNLTGTQKFNRRHFLLIPFCYVRRVLVYIITVTLTSLPGLEYRCSCPDILSTGAAFCAGITISKTPQTELYDHDGDVAFPTAPLLALACSASCGYNATFRRGDSDCQDRILQWVSTKPLPCSQEFLEGAYLLLALRCVEYRDESQWDSDWVES